MRWGVLLAIVLLAVPAALAIGAVNPPAKQCNMQYDCYKMLRSGNVTCEPGYVRDYAPKCVANKCSFCKPGSARIIRQCKRDIDCPKLNCQIGLTTQCIGMKCACAVSTKPQCYTNNDCTRSLVLARNYTKVICQRGMCVIPQPAVTALPWYSTLPTNITK